MMSDVRDSGEWSRGSPDVAGHCSVLHAAGQTKHESAQEQASHRAPEPVAEPAQGEQGAHRQGPRPPAKSVGHQPSEQVTSYGHNTVRTVHKWLSR